MSDGSESSRQMDLEFMSEVSESPQQNSRDGGRKISVGKTFGRLTVLARAPSRLTTSGVVTMWLCRCSCGTEMEFRHGNLYSGSTRSCGCYRSELLRERKRPDITGQTYGMLTVLAESSTQSKGKSRWLCRCECGNERDYRANNLRQGKTTHCGCQTGRHGDTGSKEYQTWCAMIQRCTNPNHTAYEYYGGRGIVVCERWLNSYGAFLEDMGRKPSDNHSIDRIDANGIYTKTNCRWATKREQIHNRRKVGRLDEFTNEELTVELGRRGLPVYRLYDYPTESYGDAG